MRAGRLLEIFIGTDILEIVNSKSDIKTKTVWTVEEFSLNFPNTEIIKIICSDGVFRAIVYDATAQALYEKDYDYVYKMASYVETHTFDSDIDYIEKIPNFAYENLQNNGKYYAKSESNCSFSSTNIEPKIENNNGKPVKKNRDIYVFSEDISEEDVKGYAFKLHTDKLEANYETNHYGYWTGKSYVVQGQSYPLWKDDINDAEIKIYTSKKRAIISSEIVYNKYSHISYVEIVPILKEV